MIEIANKGKNTFLGVLALRNEMDALILTYGKRAENAQTLLNRLYSRPAITANNTAALLNASHQAASALLNTLVKDAVPDEMTGYQRNRVFIFSRYVQLFHY
ncbi:MAG: Fic family protein [Cellvibrionaceae bacterium]